MGRYSVKRYKTKRRTRDLDLVYDDVSSPDTIRRLKNQEIDETKPGLGQYYCVECAKYFESTVALDRHRKSKIHKRRVKALKQRPYTPLEAEAASGLNVVKFIETVEKYKQLEEYKNAHKDEYEDLLNQKKDELDSILVGTSSKAESSKSEEDMVD